MTRTKFTVALLIAAALACITACVSRHAPADSRQSAADDAAPISPAEAARLESKFLANVHQVTFEGKSGEGYFAPDQKAILFQSIRGDHPFYQIYVKDLATGGERMVSTGFGRTTCSFFAPHSGKIIYASSHLDPERDKVKQDELARIAEAARNPQARRSYAWDFDPYMDIFEANRDGSELKQLTTEPGYDAEGSYSPDGKRIVYCSFAKGSGDIWIMDADGSNKRQITDTPGYDGGPFFSPDGKRIIFRGEARRRMYLQLFVTSVDGKPGDEIQLTDNDNVNWGPYWHPDGKHIIYATSRHGHHNYELYLMNIETRRQHRVTFTAGADVLPVFSPDGKKLMWTSTRGKNAAGETSSELWMADWVYRFDD